MYKLGHDWSRVFLSYVLPAVHHHRKLTTAMWAKFLGGKPWNRENAIAAFNAHNERIVATIPAHRLLVFDVKRGWGPLCKFLDIPEPDVPFPHIK